MKKDDTPSIVGNSYLGSIPSIQQPKGYELDWNKVKTAEDLVLLLKLIHGATDKSAILNLHDHQVDAYRHLFKENDNVE